MVQLPEFVYVCIGFFDWFQSMMQFSAMSYQWTHREKSVWQLWCIGADLDGQSRLLGVSNCWWHQWINVWPHVHAASCQNIYTMILVGYWHDNHLWTQQEMQIEFMYDPGAVYKAYKVWTWKTKRIRRIYIVVEVLKIQQEHMHILVWSLSVSFRWQEGLPS